jgi:hypothetical protein
MCDPFVRAAVMPPTATGASSWDATTFTDAAAAAPWMVEGDPTVPEMLRSIATHVGAVQRIARGECTPRVHELWKVFSNASRIHAALNTCRLEGTMPPSAKVWLSRTALSIPLHPRASAP